VQYFPDAAYLLRALKDAYQILAPGGRIVVADVRSLEVAPLHYLTMMTDTPPTDAASFTERARDLLRHERELLLDAEYFHALPLHLGEGGEPTVTVTPRSEPATTEMARFRYDVTIAKPGEEPPQKQRRSCPCRTSANPSLTPALERLRSLVMPEPTDQPPTWGLRDADEARAVTSWGRWAGSLDRHRGSEVADHEISLPPRPAAMANR